MILPIQSLQVWFKRRLKMGIWPMAPYLIEGDKEESFIFDVQQHTVRECFISRQIQKSNHHYMRLNLLEWPSIC